MKEQIEELKKLLRKQMEWNCWDPYALNQNLEAKKDYLEARDYLIKLDEKEAADKPKKAIKFQVGNYYQHSGGRVMHIIGEVNSFSYGISLLAETDDGRLSLVGMDEASAENWHRVSGWGRSQYQSNNISEPIESKA